MKGFYTLLGYIVWEGVCIVWDMVMDAVKYIQSLDDEEFKRAVQGLGPEEKKLAETIRDIGRVSG